MNKKVQIKIVGIAVLIIGLLFILWSVDFFDQEKKTKYISENTNENSELFKQGLPINNTEEVEKGFEAMPDSLLGTWQSQDDEQARMVIGEYASFAEYYGKEQVGQEGLWTYRTMSSPTRASINTDANSQEVEHYLLLSKDGETFDYRILELTADTFVLSLKGRANTLEYTRID